MRQKNGAEMDIDKRLVKELLLIAKRKNFILSPISLLVLSACGGGGGSSSGSAQIFNISGTVIKGPLENAYVFADLNNNNQFDPGEPNARTDSSGAYSFSANVAQSKIIAVTDETTVDNSSGATLSGITLSAPAGASVVTPLTTIIEEAGVSEEELADALGLSGVELTSFNPYDTVQENYDLTKAVQAEKVAQQIVNTVKVVAAAAQGAGVDTQGSEEVALQAVATAIVTNISNSKEAIASGEASEIAVIDIADAGTVGQVVENAKTALTNSEADNENFNSANLTAVSEVAKTAIQVVNEVVAEKSTEVLNSGEGLGAEASKNTVSGAFSTSQVLAEQIKTAASTGNTNSVTITDKNAALTAANNKAPQDISGLALSLPEHAESFDLGTIIVTDKNVDGSADVSNTLISLVVTNDNDSSFFAVDSGQLLFDDPALNFETKAAYKFTLKAVDDGGKAFSKTFTLNILDENDAPSGDLQIQGLPREDETLIIDTSTIADEDGLGTFNYIWMRDGNEIQGASSSTYKLSQSDVGSAISAKVVYTDLAGFENEIVSQISDLVQNVSHPVSGEVTIDGMLTQNEELTANTSALSDEDGLGEFTYQWAADGTAITGATSQTYTLTQSEVGKVITVSVSFTDGEGTSETVTSAETSAVVNVNDAPAGAVTIDGTITQNEELSANASALSDADGLGTFSYQWKADGEAIENATSQTFTLTQSEVGKAITVDVSYDDQQGTTELVTSGATNNVENVNDPATGSVTISGLEAQGSVLTLDASAVSDQDGLGTFSYEWFADGVAISGATETSFTPTQSEVGKPITVKVSFTDQYENAEQISSTATAEISNINDDPIGSLVIDGTIEEGQTLTISDNVSDADGIPSEGNGSKSYQWYRDGSVIEGETSASLVLTQSDVDTKIMVGVSYVDEYGESETVYSAETDLIRNLDTAPTGSLILSSANVLEGAVITADPSQIADEDGINSSTISYKWYRDGVEISGETSSSYTTVQADVDATITASFEFTDNYRKENSVSSSADSDIGPIVNVNDQPQGEVTIDGMLTQNEELTANTSALSDEDGLGEFTYQWAADGTAITGATSQTYTLTQSEVGKVITVSVSFTDGEGTSETVTSAETSAVVNVNDAPAGAVTIDGTITQNEELSANASALSDADGLGTFSYQWKADGEAIENATSQTFTLTQSEVGKAITVVVSYTDLQGTDESISSHATTTVVNINDAPTGTASAILPNGPVNTPYVISSSSLLFGFSDIDEDTLSVDNLVTSNGTVTDNGDGTYSVTHTTDYAGEVTLSYDVVDGKGGTKSATQSYSIAANTAPEIDLDFGFVAFDQEVSFSALNYIDQLNYYDADFDELVAYAIRVNSNEESDLNPVIKVDNEIVNAGEWISFSSEDTGGYTFDSTITITPSDEFSSISIDFESFDGKDLSNTESLTLLSVNNLQQGTNGDNSLVYDFPATSSSNVFLGYEGYDELTLSLPDYHWNIFFDVTSAIDNVPNEIVTIIDGFEKLNLTLSGGANWYANSEVAEVIYFGSGNTYLALAEGPGDSFTAGSGNFDFLDASSASITSGVQIDLSQGLVTRSGGADTVSAFEYYMGSYFDDTFIGASTTEDGLVPHLMPSPELIESHDDLNTLGDVTIFYPGPGDDLIVSGSDPIIVHYNYGFYETSTGISANLTNGTIIDQWGYLDNLTDVDAIVGSSFDDNLIGNSNENYFSPRAGNDTIDGGEGIDYVSYSTVSDASLILNLSDDSSLLGGLSNGARVISNTEIIFEDQLANIEGIFAGQGNDTVYGNSDQNLIWGLDGDDSIYGGGDTDAVLGGLGNDNLFGEDGDDGIMGQSGDDYIDGGLGNDTAYYLSASSNYSISIDDQNVTTVLNLSNNETDTLVAIETLYFFEDNKYISLDVTPPNAPTIDTFMVDDVLTTDEIGDVILSGTAEANSTINFSISGNSFATTFTTTVSSVGTWSIVGSDLGLNELQDFPADGIYTVSVSSTDENGNTSALTSNQIELQLRPLLSLENIATAISENTTDLKLGDVVLNNSATNSNYSVSLSGADADSVYVNESNELMLHSTPDFEVKDNYAFNVGLSGAGLTTVTSAVSIDVLDRTINIAVIDEIGATSAALDNVTIIDFEADYTSGWQSYSLDYLDQLGTINLPSGINLDGFTGYSIPDDVDGMRGDGQYGSVHDELPWLNSYILGDTSSDTFDDDPDNDYIFEYLNSNGGTEYYFVNDLDGLDIVPWLPAAEQNGIYISYYEQFSDLDGETPFFGLMSDGLLTTSGGDMDVVYDYWIYDWQPDVSVESGTENLFIVGDNLIQSWMNSQNKADLLHGDVVIGDILTQIPDHYQNDVNIIAIDVLNDIPDKFGLQTPSGDTSFVLNEDGLYEAELLLAQIGLNLTDVDVLNLSLGSPSRGLAINYLNENAGILSFAALPNDDIYGARFWDAFDKDNTVLSTNSAIDVAGSEADGVYPDARDFADLERTALSEYDDAFFGTSFATPEALGELVKKILELDVVQYNALYDDGEISVTEAVSLLEEDILLVETVV